MITKKTKELRGMKAVILVGGPGTRLQPLTDKKPKSIVPVLNRPFLEHTLAHLKQFGIEDVILAMSYLPDVIREYFGDGERCGIRLTYCMEKDPLGTAGAVKNAAAYLDKSFVVLNGDDVFIELNLHEAFTFHRKKKAKATIFLTRVENPSAFGVVETDDSQRVRRFIEKPPPGTETTNLINAGGYILEPEVLEQIPPGRHYMFEKGLFPRLLDIDKPVYGYTYKGYWLDMGTPGKYFSLNMDLLLSKVNSPLIHGHGKNGVYYSKDVIIHPSAEIASPVMIDSGCKIGPGVRIKGPAVIGHACRLEDGASVENAIVWDNVSVGKNSRISHCIISSDTVIGENLNIVNRIVTPSRTAPLSVS
jgi:mannose-1-phosphate guanylyltransferase